MEGIDVDLLCRPQPPASVTPLQLSFTCLVGFLPRSRGIPMRAVQDATAEVADTLEAYLKGQARADG